jgi:hypothetical protein
VVEQMIGERSHEIYNWPRAAPMRVHGRVRVRFVRASCIIW